MNAYNVTRTVLAIPGYELFFTYGVWVPLTEGNDTGICLLTPKYDLRGWVS